MVLLRNRRDENMRILLVEDDEALCAAVAPLLEQEGYRVDVCRDGDDALYYCPHTRFAGQKNNLYNGKG